MGEQGLIATGIDDIRIQNGTWSAVGKFGLLAILALCSFTCLRRTILEPFLVRTGAMSTEEKINDTHSPSGDNSISPEETSDIEREQQQVNEKSLLRKIDAQLLPAVGILYLLSFLDRSNGKF